MSTQGKYAKDVLEQINDSSVHMQRKRKAKYVRILCPVMTCQMKARVPTPQEDTFKMTCKTCKAESTITVSAPKVAPPPSKSANKRSAAGPPKSDDHSPTKKQRTESAPSKNGDDKTGKEKSKEDASSKSSASKTGTDAGTDATSSRAATSGTASSSSSSSSSKNNPAPAPNASASQSLASSNDKNPTAQPLPQPRVRPLAAPPAFSKTELLTLQKGNTTSVWSGVRSNARYCSIQCPTCKKATRIETPKGSVLKGFKVYGVQLNCGYCKFKFVVAPTVDENPFPTAEVALSVQCPACKTLCRDIRFRPPCVLQTRCQNAKCQMPFWSEFVRNPVTLFPEASRVSVKEIRPRPGYSSSSAMSSSRANGTSGSGSDLEELSARPQVTIDDLPRLLNNWESEYKQVAQAYADWKTAARLWGSKSAENSRYEVDGKAAWEDIAQRRSVRYNDLEVLLNLSDPKLVHCLQVECTRLKNERRVLSKQSKWLREQTAAQNGA